MVPVPKGPASHRGGERRQAERHSIEIAIEASVGREMLILATTNLSRTGAFLQRAIPYPVGTRVQLKIHLPDDGPAIACSGEVANVPDAKATGMGLRFSDIGPEDQRRIDVFAAVVRDEGQTLI